MSLASDFCEVSLALCFEYELQEMTVGLLELLCTIFGHMAFTIFLSADVHEIPKRVGESLFKPKCHLHSGADVQWVHLPPRVLNWALTHPVPSHEAVDTPSLPKKDKKDKSFMRRGVSGWACIDFAGSGR